MSPESSHPAELLPGYVLGDLAHHELEAVEAHLTDCAACRTEVVRLQEALYTLADDLPPATAPPGSWDRLQLRRQEAAGPHLRRKPVRSRPAWPLAAAITAALVLGGYATWMLVTPPSQQTDVSRWEAQGAVRLPLSTRTGEVFGALWVRPDGQALVVLNRPAPNGQVYQAWGRQAGGPQAAVPVSLGITDTTVMQVRWQGYGSVGISIEPAGGSPAPTQPLGRVNLPGV